MAKGTIPHSFLTALLMLCHPLMTCAEQDTSMVLARLNRIYKKSHHIIQGERSQTLSKWKKDYRSSMQTLQKDFQSVGDLDGWKAVQDKIELFNKTHLLPASAIAKSPVELRAIQLRFRQRNSSQETARSKKIIELNGKYSSALSRLEIDLTRSGRIDDAIAVKLERTFCAAEPSLRAAKFEIAQIEASSVASHDTSVTSSTDVDTDTMPDTHSGAKAVILQDGFTLHRDGRPPPYPTRLQRVTGKIPDHAKLLRNVGIGAEMAEVGNEYHLRMRLRSTSPTRIKRCKIFVQYYERDTMTSEAGVKTFEEQLLHLPEITYTSICIDCAPAQLSLIPPPAYKEEMNENGVRRILSLPGPSRHKAHPYGFIVSVFDSNDTVIAQLASNPRLAEIAPFFLPRSSQIIPQRNAYVAAVKKLRKEIREKNEVGEGATGYEWSPAWGEFFRAAKAYDLKRRDLAGTNGRRMD